jgi:hypothetical protein
MPVLLEPRKYRAEDRNLHTLVKRHQGSWSHSVFSVNYRELVGPNRDYPYQGMLAMVNNAYWKFLDALFFGIEVDGKFLNLRATDVEATPWKATYNYESPEVDLGMSYYLICDSQKEGLSGLISFVIRPKHLEELSGRLVVKPLVDMRFMYDSSSPEKHETGIVPLGGCNVLLVRRDRKALAVGFDSLSYIKREREEVEWRYKIGSGFRRKDGEYLEEFKHPVFLAEISTEFYGAMEFPVLVCCDTESRIEQRFEDALQLYRRDEKRELDYVEKVLRNYEVRTGTKKYDRALMERALVMYDKFGMYSGDVIAPEAGEFWFKAIWFRDAFEGILQNFDTVMRLPEGEEYTRKLLLYALSKQDQKTGRVPNKPPDNFNSADASLMAFMLADRYVKRKKDKKLAKKVLEHFDAAVKGFSRNYKYPNAQPIIDDKTSLLTCVPWHSWTDSKRTLYIDNKSITDLPARIVRQWQMDDYWELRDGKRVWEKSNSPGYFLPEINAQWIMALDAAVNMGRMVDSDTDDYEELLKKAKSRYKPLFWDKGRIYNLVREDGKRDPRETSMGVVAAVLLQDLVFDRKELKSMWKPHVQKLLLKRHGKPFGITVKNSEERVYYGDEQYHEGVVWLRDVPYLADYMTITGKRTMAKQLLFNILKHQTDEGVIFYNNELFSRKNAFSNELIPVKNPAQYWSQFTDAFGRVFEE